MTTVRDTAVTGPQVEECRWRPEAGTQGWGPPEGLWKEHHPTHQHLGFLPLLTAGTVASSRLICGHLLQQLQETHTARGMLGEMDFPGTKHCVGICLQETSE